LWTQHFGADKNILGKQIRMNGELYTVVGVTPPGQADRLPFQMWTPRAFKPEHINHNFHWLTIIGRLKPDVSVARAQAEMQTIADQITREHPDTNTNWGVSVEPLHNDFLPDNTVRNMWLLLFIVGFLLLMACVNIANMLLARGTARQKEVALRSALGATRMRLFSQLLIESMALAIIGGISGIALAWVLLKTLVATMPPLLPSEADIRLSIPVLLFTLATTMIAGVLFGCAPALQAARLDLNETLKQGGRTGVAGRGLRRALVVVEFALALTILAGGGLALRSFWNLTRVDLGIRPDHVLTFNLPVPQGRFSETESVNTYYRQLVNAIKAVPGVTNATVATGTPLQGTGFGMAFSIVGQPEVAPSQRADAGFEMITPDYFQTYGIRVVKGRSFTEQDTSTSVRVAMINENLAKQYFPNVDPLTQRVSIDSLIPGEQKVGPAVEWQIVGVFHNIRNGNNLRSDYPEIYVPFWQSPWPQASVAVRTAADPQQITKSIAAAVNTLDPDLPLAGIKTMDQIRDDLLQVDRFGMMLFGGFATLALLLAAVGIYGVMAFAVAQRTHEFGVRMALGAGSTRVLTLVLREGALLAFGGLVLGLGGAYLVGRAMQSTLYGVGSIDLVALSGVAIILIVAALLACYFPARRAGKVDPMVALRYE
jgi:predicted permease